MIEWGVSIYLANENLNLENLMCSYVIHTYIVGLQMQNHFSGRMAHRYAKGNFSYCEITSSAVSYINEWVSL